MNRTQRLLSTLAIAAVALLHTGAAMAQAAAQAATGPAVPAAVPGALDRAFSSMNGGGGAGLTLSLQMLIIMGLLTILPSLILMMTSFTRILVVFSILRQALGLQQSPPNQVLVGLALFMTLFIMMPTIQEINNTALQPYLAEKIQFKEALERGGRSADVRRASLIGESGVITPLRKASS